MATSGSQTYSWAILRGEFPTDRDHHVIAWFTTSRRVESDTTCTYLLIREITGEVVRIVRKKKSSNSSDIESRHVQDQYERAEVGQTSAQPPSSSLYDASLSGLSGLSTSFATRSSARPVKRKKKRCHASHGNKWKFRHLFEGTFSSRMHAKEYDPQ